MRQKLIYFFFLSEGISHIVQADLELFTYQRITLILLVLPPECCDSRCMVVCLIYMVLGRGARASCMLGKGSTDCYIPSPFH